MMRQVNRLKYFIASEQYIEGYMLSQNLAFSGTFNNNQNLLNFYESSNYDDELNKQLNDLRESIRFELQERQVYYSAFFTRDLSWWQEELKQLNQKIENSDDLYESFAYQRIKAFLGITCYSLTSKSFRTDDLEAAEKLIPVYALIEPENADMYYFSALLAGRKGDVARASAQLEKAIQAGFDDTQQIQELEAIL